MSLVYEGISSCLHNKRQKALQNVYMAIENKENLGWNKNFSFRRFNGNVW